MKLGIMQPYFLPYIGYWQLLNAVDQYVIYDDVNFINRGWINRNRILQNGAPAYINVPMIGASQTKKINEISVNRDDRMIKKTLRTVEQNYRKAPQFNEVMPLLEEIFATEEDNLARFLARSIRIVCRYLDIKTTLLISSELEKNNELKGQDKILDICRRLGATQYINAIGGQTLYERAKFEQIGIDLKFLQTKNLVYQQWNSNFIPCLSILDVMMFNEHCVVKKYLEDFDLF